MVRAHPEVAYTYTTVGSASGSGAVDAARSTCDSCRSTSARSARRRSAAICARSSAHRRRDGVHVRGGRLRRQPEAAAAPAAGSRREHARRSSPIRSRDRAHAARRGRRRSLDARAEAGARASTSIADSPATLGVSLGQLATSLRSAFAGVDAGTWVDPTGKSRYVHVRLAPESRGKREPISASCRSMRPAAAHRAAPRSFRSGRWRRSRRASGPAQIDHYQRQRVVTIGANVLGASIGNVAQDVTRAREPRAAAAGLSHQRRADRSRARTRCSARSSPRSASRSC